MLVGLNISFGGGSRKSAEPAPSTYVPERIVEKIVEKVVEKRVEVPVEVVKEVKVPGGSSFSGTYEDDLFFLINQAELRPDEAFKLGRIAQIMKDNPDAKITVTGHADSGTGTDAINQTLSEQRAQVVVDMLKKAGIAASRIISKAVGGDRDASMTPEANRVAVCILK